MEISYKGKDLCLKGLTSSTIKLIDDSENSTISKVGSKGLWLWRILKLNLVLVMKLLNYYKSIMGFLKSLKASILIGLKTIRLC